MKRDLAAKYGPYAVVTGASAGIGAELAAQLAAAGLNLVLVARRRDVLERKAEGLRTRYRVDVRTIDLDLGRGDAAEEIDHSFRRSCTRAQVLTPDRFGTHLIESDTQQRLGDLIDLHEAVPEGLGLISDLARDKWPR